jgi:hypothetical protein
MVGNLVAKMATWCRAEPADLRVRPLTARRQLSAKFLSDLNGVARTLVARSCRGAPQSPEGLAWSRMGKAARSTWAQLSSRAIPALSPRRRVRAKLPGCRHPALPPGGGQGGADAQLRPHPR